MKKPVDLIVLLRGTHRLIRRWVRMASQQGNVDWFFFWLKGEETPTGADKSPISEIGEAQALTELAKP
jgi:hypothetical protein